MISKCGKCGGLRFELAEVSPEKSNFKFQFVQCASCGNPIGVANYFDTHSDIEVAKTEIKKLGRKIDDVQNALVQIAHAMSRR